MALLDDYLTRVQLADELGLNPRTIDRWMSKPDGLPYHRLGKRKLFKRDTIQVWLSQQEIRPNARRATR